jgi:hypothetical protein
MEFLFQELEFLFQELKSFHCHENMPNRKRVVAEGYRGSVASDAA